MKQGSQEEFYGAKGGRILGSERQMRVGNYI